MPRDTLQGMLSAVSQERIPMKATTLLLLTCLAPAALAQSLTVEQFVAAEVADTNAKLQQYGQPQPGVHTFPAVADGDTIIYRFGVPAANHFPASGYPDQMRDLKAAMLPEVCGILQASGHYRDGLQMQYEYETGDAQPMGSFVINKRACDNYADNNAATCMIEQLAPINNDSAARAAVRVCTTQHPGGLDSVPQGIGRLLAHYSSGDECTVKNGSDTPSEVAAVNIRRACNKLYNPSSGLFDDLIPN